MDPLREENLRMLEIALAPAPVAGRKINQRGGRLFVTSANRWQHVNGVARAAHQGGLDEVVTQDMAAKGRPPRQNRQAAMSSERPGTDDCIVAPVIAVAAHGDRNTRSNDRAVMRAANCCRRANSVLRLTMRGR